MHQELASPQGMSCLRVFVVVVGERACCRGATHVTRARLSARLADGCTPEFVAAAAAEGQGSLSRIRCIAPRGVLVSFGHIRAAGQEPWIRCIGQLYFDASLILPGMRASEECSFSASVAPHLAASLMPAATCHFASGLKCLVHACSRHIHGRLGFRAMSSLLAPCGSGQVTVSSFGAFCSRCAQHNTLQSLCL